MNTENTFDSNSITTTQNFEVTMGDILGFRGHRTEENEKFTISGIYSKEIGSIPNNNKLVFGKPANDKDNTIVINDIIQAMRRGDSVIVTGLNKEVYNTTAQIMKDNGYLVKNIDFNSAGLAESESDRWNMFRYVDNTFLGENQAYVIAEAVIATTTSPYADVLTDFWLSNEKNCLKAAILYISQHSEKKNIQEVIKLISQKEGYYKIFESLSQNDPAKKAYDMFNAASDQTKAKIIESLCVRLQSFNNDTISTFMTSGDTDIIAPVKKKCIYYIQIAKDRQVAEAILISQMIQAQMDYVIDAGVEGKIKQIPVTYMLNNFESLPAIPELDINLGILRSRNISVTVTFDNFAQLKDKYSNGRWINFLNNMSTVLMLGPVSLEDIDTLDELNSMFNKEINDKEALDLTAEELLVFIRGHKPIKLYKYSAKVYNPIILSKQKT